MVDMFNTNISIEEMAAYLDGNLSENEMENMSEIINKNNDLRLFSQINNQIEEVVSEQMSLDYELPLELQSQDFELPSFDDVAPDFDSLFDEFHADHDCSTICGYNHENKDFTLHQEENTDVDNPGLEISQLDDYLNLDENGDNASE